MVEFLGTFGRGSSHKGRPPPLAAISPEGKLGDHQQTAAQFQERPIHLALLVSEDPQVDNLLCQVGGIPRPILAPYPEENQEAAADTADLPAINPDLCS
jgi:hypothetical protein